MKNKLLIIPALFLISCGTRNVNKSNTTESVETETHIAISDSSKTVTNTESNIKVIDSTDEVEILPIDNSIPMVVNGKKYVNARLKHRKTSTNTNQSVKVSQIEQKAVKTDVKNKTDANKKVDDFHSHREGFNFNWLWLLLIPIGIYLFIKSKKIIEEVDRDKII